LAFASLQPWKNLTSYELRILESKAGGQRPQRSGTYWLPSQTRMEGPSRLGVHDPGPRIPSRETKQIPGMRAKFDALAFRSQCHPARSLRIPPRQPQRP
jgi:hypothetical protein